MSVMRPIATLTLSALLIVCVQCPVSAAADLVVEITGPDRIVYDSLAAPQAAASSCFDVVPQSTFATDLGTYTFLDGTLTFFERVGGRPTGCLFRGRGRLDFCPLDANERAQLARFCKDTVLAADVGDVYFRYFDTAFSMRLRHCGGDLSGEKPPAPKELASYEVRAADDLTLALPVRGWQLLSSDPLPRFLYIQPEVKGQRRLHFLLDETADEPVTVWRVPAGAHGKGTIDLVCSYDRPRTAEEVRQRSDLRRGGFDVASYKTDATIERSGDMALDVTVTASVRRRNLRFWEFYCAPELKLDSIRIGGVACGFVYHKRGAWIVAADPETRSTGDTVDVRFHYRADELLDKYPWGDFAVRYTTRWLPVGAPHRRASYETTFRFPKHYDLVSCGDRLSDSTGGDWRIQRWRTIGRAAFISFSIGSFERLGRQIEGGPLLEIYRSRNHQRGLFAGDINSDVAEDIAGALQLFDTLFGRYPWPHLAATEIPAGHGQGFPQLLHLGWQSFEHSQKGVTDAFRAHEVAHQWFGHYVGWDSYRDQWLSEGFAEYAGAMYVQARYDGNEEFFKLVRQWRDDILEVGGGPFWHEGPQVAPIGLGYRCSSVSSPGSYLQLVYAKGAYVLHMLRQMMYDYQQGTDERFLRMMQDYVSQGAGKDATTIDFQHIAERHVGSSLDWFFDQWVYGVTIPRYEYSWRVEPAGAERWIVHGQIDQFDTDSTFTAIMPVTYVFDEGRRTVLQRVTGPQTTFSTPPLDLKPRQVVFNDYHSILCREKVVSRP